MAPLLPVALNLQNVPCLVVGGGKVACRKTASLLECEARVTVVSPDLSDEFAPLQAGIEHRARVFEPGDCDGFRLVFACTDSREVNALVLREAREAGAWASVADDAGGSDFHSMATVRRGEICLAVSTGGNSPALSRHLRQKLETAVGPEYEALLDLLGQRRAALKANVSEQHERAALWRRVLESDVLPLLREGRVAEAERMLDEIVGS